MKKLVMLFVFSLCFAGFVMGQSGNSLIGKWILYNPELGERDFIEAFFIEFNNNIMIQSTVNLLVPGRSSRDEIDYSLQGNNIILNSNGELSTIQYEIIRENTLYLTTEYGLMQLKRITNDNKGLTGKYTCFIGSTATIEILDESNIIFIAGLSYNQQPGEYRIIGENRLFITINNRQYIFDILENGAVLFGRTDELKGAFINILN